MSQSSFPSRAVVVALVLATAATSGCSWFRKGNELYAGPAENRPLEVPPPLEAATTANAASSSATASAMRPSATAAQAAPGFSVAGTRDEVYARVGDALAGVQGVAITSRAQLLGAYDVTYDGASFLVRVSGTENSATVSAVDPRGLPATGDAPRRLMDTLRAALAR